MFKQRLGVVDRRGAGACRRRATIAADPRRHSGHFIALERDRGDVLEPLGKDRHRAPRYGGFARGTPGALGPDALDQATNAAQHYPYFIQVVGRELHRSAKAEPDKLVDGNRIGGAILEQALEAFRIARNTYYADRWTEIEAGGILFSAEAVARLFVAQKTISISTAAVKSTIDRSIGKKLEERAKERGEIEPALWVEANLRNVGFIWSQFGNEDRCEPGIPSLMNYVMERGDERDRELKRIREST